MLAANDKTGLLCPMRVLLRLAAVMLAVIGLSSAQSRAAGPAANLPLNDAERAFIAEIEHRALTLSKKGFPAFKAAIKEADLGKVQNFFADSFEGKVLDLTKGEDPKLPWLHVKRVKATAASPAAKVTGAEFARQLIGLRQRFEGTPELEMKLLDLAPVQREEMDGVWRGTCNLRYAGRLGNGHPAEVFLKIQFEFLRIADVDLIMEDKGWIKSMHIFEGYECSTQKPLLSDASAARGLNPDLFWDNWKKTPEESTVVSGGVYLSDLNDDGRDEVLITDINGLFLFGLNGQGQFEEMTTQWGLPRNLRAVVNAVFGDFDNDNWPDLILDNRVFRNTGAGRFEEVNTTLRFGNIRYLSGYTVGDYDKDGLLDIYVTRSFGAQGRYGKNSWLDGPGGPGNQLWRNRGQWQFEEVSDSANARAGRRSSFTASWLDANNDGFPDIYVINEFGGGILLVNQKNGSFKEQALVEGPGDFGSMGLAAADINNDGLIDVYTANMYSKAGRRIVGNLSETAYAPEVMAKMKRFFPGSELYQNMGGLKFKTAGDTLHVRAVGWAYGPAFVDLNNDGFLDIYATSGFASVNKEEPDG